MTESLLPFTERFDTVDSPPQAVRLPDEIGPVLAWAKAKPRRQFAGLCKVPTACPLARYLESLGAPWPYVDLNKYAIGMVTAAEGWRPLPDWALRVAQDVDATGRQAVTFARFVRILETVASQS